MRVTGYIFVFPFAAHTVILENLVILRKQYVTVIKERELCPSINDIIDYAAIIHYFTDTQRYTINVTSLICVKENLIVWAKLMYETNTSRAVTFSADTLK